MTTVVFLSEPDVMTPMIRWGVRLAHVFEDRAIFLVSESTPEKEVRDEVARAWAAAIDAFPPADSDSRSAQNQNASADAGSAEADEPPFEVRTVDCGSLRETLEVLAESKASRLLLTKVPKKSGHRDRPLVRQLYDAAPCTVVVLRPVADGERCRRIMVPTGGGPNGAVALELADAISERTGAELVPLYVDVITASHEEVADRRLTRILERQGLKAGDRIHPKTVLARDVWSGVHRACTDDIDLLLIGESNVGVIRRTLFGTVPDRLLRDHSDIAVGVVRRPWPLLDRLRARVERFLDLTIPQMDRQDRVALFDRLQSGSAWNFDFMVLIVLSTAIASLGLIQSSAAVVIGAMLVAPLMTPLLGAGLALIQGNLPLLLRAAQAILLGFLCALGIGLGLGWLVPVPQLTPELLARGGPTVLDLAVGFLSGFAAAYCSGRSTLSAALPGVAIAAALVPPIATAGVSIAMGETANARGAAMLFGTNVVAIVVGAALALYGGGVRPAKFESAQRWRRWTFLGLIFALVVLAVPLSSWLLADLRNQFRREFTSGARELVEARVDAIGGAEIEDFAWREEENGLRLRLVLRSPAPPTQDWAESLDRALEEQLGEPVELQVTTRLVLEVR